jgi:hypothetical protein
MVSFLEYTLESKSLILGERVKGSIFRPSCKTLRWSTITMALRKMFGFQNVHAVGVLDNYNVSYFVYSPAERITRVSKIPLQVEVLTNVVGRVYIVKENNLDLPKEFEICLGALISKGFGRCKLKFKEEIKNVDTYRGILLTRIPLKYLEKFLIKKIIYPVYGYLFEPTSETSGVYIKSVFEGSEVVGPKFLLKQENG